MIPKECMDCDLGLDSIVERDGQPASNLYCEHLEMVVTWVKVPCLHKIKHEFSEERGW